MLRFYEQEGVTFVLGLKLFLSMPWWKEIASLNKIWLCLILEDAQQQQQTFNNNHLFVFKR